MVVRNNILLPLPRQYLRLMDPRNFDPRTGQRIGKLFNANSGKPLLQSLNNTNHDTCGIDRCFIQRQGMTETSLDEFIGIVKSRATHLSKNPTGCNTTTAVHDVPPSNSEEKLIIQWSDGLVSQFTVEWIARQVRLWHQFQQSHDIPKDFSSDSLTGNPCHDDYVDEKWMLDNHKRVMWKSLTESDIRKFTSPITLSDRNCQQDIVLPPISIPFHDIVNKHNIFKHGSGSQQPTGTSSSFISGMALALEALYRYGFLLVTDTPLHHQEEAIAALASSVSGGSNKSSPHTSLVTNYLYQNNDNHPTTVLPDGTDGALRTLYGSVWTTNSDAMATGQSVADSAYGQEALPLHTDMTYSTDPPGLQIFSMKKTAHNGGQSTFADGFSIAERLRTTCPEAFRTLASIRRRYRSIDHVNGWNLQATGPIIQTWPDGTIQSIRHNELDRMPDLPPYVFPVDHPEKEDCISHFYEQVEYADYKWKELIATNEFTLVLDLKPGDTVVVANHRCLHGRFSFQNSVQASRSIVGCYVSQDELMSRFRIAGLMEDF
jgi:alpha-ketoglutarate-dependent taurine dioxygenase